MKTILPQACRYKMTTKTVDITTLVGSVKPVFDRETVRKNIDITSLF